MGEDIFGLSNSIFQLGIGPYIDASWTLSSILLLKVPQGVYAHLQALRRAGREVGTAADPALGGARQGTFGRQPLHVDKADVAVAWAQGQAVIKMYTQIGSLAFAVLLGAKRGVELLPQAAQQRGFITGTMLTLVAGAMLMRFVADQNQDYGLGDGIALLICSGMASGAPVFSVVHPGRAQ